MYFLHAILLLLFISVHSKLLTYTVYQTDEICPDNWKGSICLPIFPLPVRLRSIQIQVNLNEDDYREKQCSHQTLIYIRSRSCLYCPNNIDDIHCHQRLKRMTPTDKPNSRGVRFAFLIISLSSIVAIGSLFTLFIIKRSKAQTNLLENQNIPIRSSDDLRPVKQIKVPPRIKLIPKKEFELKPKK